MWTKEQEIDFFNKALKIASPETLFYTTKDKRYLAYWPKKWRGTKSTLQSRNAYIGDYTEKWTREVLMGIAKDFNGYAVNNVVCEELGLSPESSADVAICKTNSRIQKADDIILIIEVRCQ
ncbi:MAG: hypothetical protein ACP5M7_09985 [Thermoproteota archaeon]